MIDIIAALAPVVLVMALGQGLARTHFLTDQGFGALDRIVYFVFFPSLLFSDLAMADLRASDAIPLALALIAAQSFMALVLLILRRRLALDGPAFSSVFQGAVRWNSFVALALAMNLRGQAGTAMVAVGLAVMVPMANVLSVYVLARHAQGRSLGIGPTVSMLARNPLLIACLLGIASHALPPLPHFILKAAQISGAATLPLGLISAGAGLDFSAFRSAGPTVAMATLLKLIAMPILVGLTCVLFGVSGPAFEMAVLCGAVPGATMSYVLARQMNGDAPLMAAIITATTLGSAVSLPIALTLARALW
jgi:predicted permease